MSKYYCGNCEMRLSGAPSRCPNCEYMLEWRLQSTRGRANVKYVHSYQCEHERTYYVKGGERKCSTCGDIVD